MSRRDENKFKKNKYLSKEERQAKRNKKNRVYKINYFRLAILLFAFVIIVFLFIFGISKAIAFFNSDKKTVETVGESKKETIKEYKSGETSKKIEKINSFLKNKNDKLENNIEEYLANNKLEKSKTNIAYSKINNESFSDSAKEEDFIYSDKEKLPMNNANIFIISMIAEDMEKQGLLDLNTIVEIMGNNAKEESEESEKDSGKENAEETSDEKTDESQSESETSREIDKDKASSTEKSKNVTLYELINDMIKKPETWKIKLVLEYVEKAAKSDWKTYANEFYNLSINTQNEMPIKEVLEVFKLAFKKQDGHFIYSRTVDSLINASQENKDLYYIETNNFMGFIGVYEFSYTMEIGYIMGEEPYVYLIQTDYSDKSINTELRNIINDWHVLYN